jgi:hypothetical protein
MKISAMSTAISVAYAVVMATGLLTITLGLIAFVNDTSFVEYYQYVFPRFRGGKPPIRIPVFAYAWFVMYIAVAATIAVHARKRIDAWHRRRIQ